MKKFLIVLVTLLVLCGCASNTNEVEKGPKETENVSYGEETILSEVTDKEAVNGAAASRNNRVLKRADFATEGNKSIKAFKDEEVVTRSGVTKGNDDFLEFMDFVYQALYDDIPAEAEFPAVKYIGGEWTFAITAQKEILGTAFDEIGFAEIAFNTENGLMTIVLHPRVLHYEDELYTESDEDAGYLPFTGSRQENKTFLLSDSDGLMISVRYYYEVEGHEYVRARMYCSEDQYADILFFRVQQ